MFSNHIKITILDRDYTLELKQGSNAPFDLDIRILGSEGGSWILWDSVMMFLMYGLEDRFTLEADQKLFSIVVRKICECILE
jgi:hypothetical protein